MKNFGFYCSGGASRLLKFYQDENRKTNFQPKFIYYDGQHKNVISLLGFTKPDLTKLIVTDNKVFASTKKEFSQTVSNELNYWMNKFNVDYLFCFGDKILKKPLTTDFNMRIINFHPSLLPAFPGRNAIDQALESSVQILGNTAHFIVEEIDSGPVILQSIISRSNYNCYDDVLDLQIPMLEKIWNWLENENIEFKNGRVIINKIDKQKEIFFSA